MKLKSRWDYGSPPKEYTVAQAVDIACRAELVNGELERVRDQVDSVVGMVAGLMKYLHESGAISDEQVLALLGSFEKLP